MRRPALLLTVQIVAVVAILASVVALAALHPWRLDLTPDRRFTLSSHTREVLRRVEQPVRIVVFYSSQEGVIRREMADLFALYHEAQPRVDVQLHDLDRSPGLAQREGISNYNTGIVEAGERRERLEVVNEDTLTAALLAVAGTPSVVTYFVTGHGEHDPRSEERTGASDAARALATEGFRVRGLEGAATLPADAGLVVLAGPTRELGPAEVDALATYVRRGGHLLVLADPGAPASLDDLLRRFGVELAGDVIVDEQGRLFGADGLSAHVAYLNQTLIADPPEVQALLPVAQSIRLVDEPGGPRADYLAVTGETTWADVDRRVLADGEAVFRPDHDRHGPLPVAALVRVAVAGDGEGRLVVVGDADFVTNLHLNVLGNRDLLLTGADLVARAQVVAGNRPPGPQAGTFSPLTLTRREGHLVFWTVVVAPSGLVALVALARARRRRWA